MRTRPEHVDEHGVRHRYGCEPDWTSRSPPVAGITIARCTGCGATRITRPTDERNE